MNKREAIELVWNKHFSHIKFNRVKFSKEQLLTALSKSTYNLSNELGYSHSASLARLTARWFPNKPRTHSKICHYILSLEQLKYCPGCNLVKSFELFNKNSQKTNELAQECRDCCAHYQKEYQEDHKSEQCARTNKRRASKLNATPKWADLVAIKEFYINRPEGYHVDHIVPLQGKEVCGLHVIYNLQYLPARDNLSKGNR